MNDNKLKLQLQQSQVDLQAQIMKQSTSDIVPCS